MAQRVERWLTIDVRGHGDAVEVREICFVEVAQLLIDIHIAIEVDIAVRRVIISRVEVREHLLRELRNRRRVAAGLIVVRRIGIECGHDLALEQIVRRGKRALHLVVDDAAVSERCLRALDFIVPALLHEHLRVLAHRGIEYRVEIDIHEILEILIVAARDRIHRLVRVRHRIEECIEAAFDELDKRLLERIFARAAKRRVLDDMRDARVIRRRRAERDGEYLVVVRRLQIEHTRTAFFVRKLIRRHIRLGHRRLPQQAKAVVNLLYLHGNSSLLSFQNIPIIP